MDVYLQPLVSYTSFHGNPQAEKDFLPDDCRVMMCMKPMVADKHPYY